ncbi:MAG: type II toxin-antitoxin system PemK/MazF family toxin [Streptococcaceae bacterium]|jgi:mRNA interferase MazF|nr:type II toxin-antitoxin system PemK/MazF family toxin [Streptococcaceae bacterium]
MSYKPSQKDVIWIDFDPARGFEINKRRPAVVLSSNDYNNATKYAIVAPITQTDLTAGNLYELKDHKTKGKVNTAQIYSLDVTKRANRKPEFIEKMKEADFQNVAQLVKFNFDF